MSAMAANQRLGRIGIWSMELRFGEHAAAEAAAAELDELGFGALWIPGGMDGAVLKDVDRLLAVTKRTTIATGILNLWKHEPRDIAAWFNGQPADRQARIMLGIGVSHGPIIGAEWKNPVAVMRNFLDRLAEAGMPADHTCLAALGPKMLELSRDRTGGAHPYLVTAEHSAMARRILGPGKLLAPEQGVVMESDPAKARQLARQALVHYGRLPNYRQSWRRLGFSEDEIEGGSDRLIDALFAWGGVEEVVKRTNAHLAAGADHVCLQVIQGAGPGDFAAVRPLWRQLAAGLL